MIYDMNDIAILLFLIGQFRGGGFSCRWTIPGGFSRGGGGAGTFPDSL